MRTPTATMVGTGFGAHNGISIEGGRALNASNGIKAIVLHRTGTVMEGKMQVAELSWVPSHAAFLELETLETPSADDGTPRSTIPAIVSATEIAPNNSSLGRSQSMAKQLSKMPDLATQIARSTLLRESPVQVSRASYPFRTLLRLIGSTLYSSGTLNSPVREMTSSPIPI